MKKIKRFKINVRPSYFLRLLKNSIDIDKDEVRNQIKDNYELVDPCTIYESFKLEDIKDEEFRKKVEGWAPDIKINPYSVLSLIIVTVGSRIEGEVSKLKIEGNERYAKILDALGSEALEQSYNFVNKLILKTRKKRNVRWIPFPGFRKMDWKPRLNCLTRRRLELPLTGNRI